MDDRARTTYFSYHVVNNRDKEPICPIVIDRDCLIKIVIQDEVYLALVDSGSQVNLMSKDMIESVKPQFKSALTMRERVFITTACCQEEAVTGMYTVEFMILDFKCETDFYIVNQTNKIILGTPFLRKYGVILNFNTHEITLGKNVKLSVPDYTDLDIFPGSYAVIAADVRVPYVEHGSSLDGLVIEIPSCRIDSDCLIQAAVSSVCDNSTPIVVCNVGVRPFNIIDKEIIVEAGCLESPFDVRQIDTVHPDFMRPSVSESPQPTHANSTSITVTAAMATGQHASRATTACNDDAIDCELSIPLNDQHTPCANTAFNANYERHNNLTPLNGGAADAAAKHALCASMTHNADVIVSDQSTPLTESSRGVFSKVGYLQPKGDSEITGHSKIIGENDIKEKYISPGTAESTGVLPTVGGDSTSIGHDHTDINTSSTEQYATQNDHSVDDIAMQQDNSAVTQSATASKLYLYNGNDTMRGGPRYFGPGGKYVFSDQGAVLPPKCNPYKDPMANEDADINDKRPSDMIDFSKSLLDGDVLAECKKVFNNYRTAFIMGEFDFGYNEDYKLRITLKPGCMEPIALKPFRLSPNQLEIARKQLNRLQRLGVITDYISEYNSPAFLVKKKFNSSHAHLPENQNRQFEYRVVIDFRQINARVVFPSIHTYTVPETLDTLGKCISDLQRGNKLLITSAFDLPAAYHQLAVDPESMKYLAFQLGDSMDNSKTFVTLPMGFSFSGTLLYLVLKRYLGSMYGKNLVFYADDVIVLSTLETTKYGYYQHVNELDSFLRGIARSGLKLHPTKTEFARFEQDFLGYRVSAEGIAPSPRHVRAIKQFPIPRDVRQLQAFVGLITYFHKHIKNRGTLVAPLTKLFKKDEPYVWGAPQQEAFQKLVDILTGDTILAHPDFEERFYLQTDASTRGIGACLLQRPPGMLEKVIAYYGTALTATQSRYPITALELLAAAKSMIQFKYFLQDKEFTLITDHSCLKQILTQSTASPLLRRLALTVQNFQFTIEHRSGKTLVIPDAISRASYAMQYSFEFARAYENGALVPTWRERCDLETNFLNDNNPNTQMVPDELVDQLALPVTEREVCVLTRSKLKASGLPLETSLPQPSKRKPTPAPKPDKRDPGPTVRPKNASNNVQSPTKTNVKRRGGKLECLIQGYSTEEIVEKVSELKNKLDKSLQDVNWVDAQRRDPTIMLIKDWLSGKTIQDKAITQFMSTHDHEFMNLSELIIHIMESGIDRNTPVFQIVVPDELKLAVIKRCHIEICHMGVLRTVEALRQQYYWRSLIKDVTIYVTSCPECIEFKHGHLHATAPYSSHEHSMNPWGEACLDVIGPLNKSRNFHILVS